MWRVPGRGMCTGKGLMVKSSGIQTGIGLAGVQSLRGKAGQKVELIDSIYITQGLLACTESSRSHFQTLASWDTIEPPPFQKEEIGVHPCVLAIISYLIGSLPWQMFCLFVPRDWGQSACTLLHSGCKFRRADFFINSSKDNVPVCCITFLKAELCHFMPLSTTSWLSRLFSMMFQHLENACVFALIQRTPLWYFCSIYREIRSCSPMCL